MRHKGGPWDRSQVFWNLSPLGVVWTVTPTNLWYLHHPKMEFEGSEAERRGFTGNFKHRSVKSPLTGVKKLLVGVLG